MNCHTAIRPDSPKLAKVKSSYETGMPIEWIKIHNVGDFAYFNHAAHVNRGVGCVTCHGRVDRMEVVYQKSPLSMGWCLQCHRNPIQNLRPPSEVTNMTYDMESLTPSAREALRDQYKINPSENCSTCHR